MPAFRRCSLVLLLAGALVGGQPGGAFGQREAESLSASFRKAARQVAPTVVSVRSAGAPTPFPLPEVVPFGGPGGTSPREGGGSGVVIDAEHGYVLTNDHVVQGASRVTVVLADGRERVASQVRRDPKSDLALLVIEPKGLTQAVWGDSDRADIGDWVLAVGQAFGLSGTVTAGIISGKGRGIGVALYEDLIQTDAAINPGNSGGPLVTLDGSVIGINTVIRTQSGGYDGVGFAVPAARARRVAADLAEHGKVRRSYLGVRIGPLDPATADRLELPGAVVINGVMPDGPAAEAGLQVGDVLLTLGGRTVQGVGWLQSAIEVAAVGEPLALTLRRGEETREVRVTPRAQPESFGLPGEPEPLEGFREGLRPADPAPDAAGRVPARPEPLAEPELTPAPRPEAVSEVHYPDLGLRVGEAKEPGAGRSGREASGVVIVAVDRDGPADRGGLQPGMVIDQVARRRVDGLSDFREAVSRRPGGRDLLLRIRRGSRAEFRVIPDVERAPDDPAPKVEEPKTDPG